MNKENFDTEVEKTLDVSERWPNPDLDDFFYTRLKARLESEVSDGWSKIAAVLAGLKFKVAFVSLIMFNVFTAYKLFGDTAAVAQVTRESEESDDYYNYNTLNYSY